MVNIGRSVRKISAHGYDIEDDHSADEENTRPLHPSKETRPETDVPLYKGCRKPQYDGEDKGLHLPCAAKVQSEDQKSRPGEAAGRTGEAGQTCDRTYAPEQNI